MRIGKLAGLLAISALAVLGCAATAEDQDTHASQVNETDLPACLPTLDCAAPEAPAFAPRSWRHWIETPLITAQGSASHRGRDLFVTPDQPQTIIAQFAYGMADVDLVDEEIDIYVQRDCASGWEKLGTATTTRGPDFHPPVEGVDDTGGRIYYEIPQDKRLGPGRHRVRLVVGGDGSSTDLFIDVVPPQTPIFVSDVDGTLTASENVEFTAMLTGTMPETHLGAPEALRLLAKKGYRPLYLTARPDWLTQRTRGFLDQHGFPPGIVHTSTSIYGAGFGASATSFKADELAMLATKGLVPEFGFGNKPSDSEAYAPIDPQKRFFYRISGEFVGRKIEWYAELFPTFNSLPAACK